MVLQKQKDDGIYIIRIIITIIIIIIETEESVAILNVLTKCQGV